MHHFILSLLLCLTLLGCSNEQSPKESKSMAVDKMMTSNEAPKGVTFTGQVVYVPVEGGFWAIITDDGKKLNGAVPKSLHIENQKVSGTYEVQEGMMSFRMWGQVVAITELHAVESINYK